MTSNTKLNFAKNLKRFLSERSMKQTDFATAMGTTTNTVQTWVKGRTIPNAESLDKMSEVLSIEVSELFIRDVESEFSEEYLSIVEKYAGNSKKQMDALKELGKKYDHIGAGEVVHNYYVQPLGKVLPGITSHLIELLKMADIQNSNNKNYYLINTLLAHLIGDNANDSAFMKMVQSDPGIKEEFEFRKKQLARIAAEIAGVPDPTSIPVKPNLIDEIATRALTEIEYREYMGSGGSAEFMRILKLAKESENPFITSTWFNKIQEELAVYANYDQMEKIKKNQPSNKKVSGDNN